MKDTVILVLLAVIVLTAPIFTYKLGRKLERKALTAALVDTIEATYAQGYQDGQLQDVK